MLPTTTDKNMMATPIATLAGKINIKIIPNNIPKTEIIYPIVVISIISIGIIYF
jgi:hypothetical protein